MKGIHIGRMSFFSKFAFSVTVAVFAVTALRAQADPALAVNDQAAGLKAAHDFPTIKLRGYGTVSGKAWSDSAGGSLVQIDCADTEHARLVQAKYLSDLEELPPGTKSAVVDVNGTRVTIQTAENVGAVAALRAGTTVILAAAPSADALAKLITAGVKGTAAQWTSVAEGKVPMFLDRFDKYGFRWYYAPGVFPPKPNDPRHGDDTYDVTKDFDWMQATHTGLTVWTSGVRGVTPEWLTIDPRWEWTLGEAKQRGLPVGINLGLDGAAYWYFNRNPESLMPYVPGFLGTYYGSMNFGIPNFVSWCSPTGLDTLLAQLQQTVKKDAPVENITSWLEPHEELGGGIADLLIEHGPAADESFHAYLKEHYKTLAAVSQRYSGDPAGIKSWNEIHAPEPADFLGWGPDAVDLTGTWKVSFEAANNPEALGATFDDSSWGEMEAPGNAIARLLPQQKPAVWRRHFNLDSGWQAGHQAIWLYVFDLNDTRAAGKGDAKAAVTVTLNGKPQPEKPVVANANHWNAYNVTQDIQAGDNILAVRLPRGLFNYRVYLSGQEPKGFPQLDGGKNALWTDYITWLNYLRRVNVARGMQMIRQVDPDRGIVLMAPDTYADAVLQDAIAYGGDFHNTGYMGGWWCDKLPALMRGAGLPFSTEPSQGPTQPNHIMGEMGNWICEGVNSIDHFQNIGEVLYHPDLKKTFEDHVPLYTSIGRWHAPFAQIAVIYSNRLNNLFGWPFSVRPASDEGEPFFRSCGYPSGFNIRGSFSPMEFNPPGRQYESDAVDEEMFARDQVDPAKYKVIVDTDTEILEDDVVAGIERYVKAGGVFVTFGDTGRSTGDKLDSWPISRLSGFDVVSIHPGKGTLSLDAAQTIFPAGASFTGNSFGLRLSAKVPEAKSLLNWNDGSTAVGLRPLGKGFVVQVGPYNFGSAQNANAFFSSLFSWLKIDPEPATLQGGGKIFWRRYVSNNGLFDLWTFRNQSFDAAQTGTLQLDEGVRPPWMVDLNSGTRTAVTDGQLPVNLPPGETVQLIVPRANVGDSTSEWFRLQRGWWQGTTDPGPPFPQKDLKNIVDLSDGWAFQAVDPSQPDAKALVGVMSVNDSTWPKMPFGIFPLPDHPEVRHFVVRRSFTVPAAWAHGETALHLGDLHGLSTPYMDGSPLRDAPPLTAGSTHLLAIEFTGKNNFLGSTAPAWLSYHPDAPAKQDLTTTWEISSDAMHWTGTTTIPGPVAKGTRALRATIVVNPAAAGQNIVLHARQATGQLRGAIVNGTWVVPHVNETGEIDLNITPWVAPGHKNEFVLVLGGSAEDIHALSLDFFPKGSYP